jgi:beta-galactosidase
MIQVGFNENWIFCRKDETSAVNVTLPHDAMIGEVRRPDCESGSAGAYFPGGIYQYKKTFVAEREWQGKQILIEFEGVYQNAVIYINGTQIGQIVYGYTGAHFDISGVLEYGRENTMRLSNQMIRLRFQN